MSALSEDESAFVDQQLKADDKPETPRRGRRKPKTRNPNRDAQGHFTSAPGAPPKPRRGRPPKRRERDDLEAPLTQMFFMVGTFWHGIETGRYEDHPEPTCGAILNGQAPAIAAALNAVAQEDESVYRWLSAMMTGGGWGAVAFAVLPVANAVITTHAMPAMAGVAERRRMRAQLRQVEPTFPETVPEPNEPTTTTTEDTGWRPPNEIPPDDAAA